MAEELVLGKIYTEILGIVFAYLIEEHQRATIALRGHTTDFAVNQVWKIDKIVIHKDNRYELNLNDWSGVTSKGFADVVAIAILRANKDTKSTRRLKIRITYQKVGMFMRRREEIFQYHVDELDLNNDPDLTKTVLEAESQPVIS